MLAPARMPVAAGKKMENTEKNVSWPRKSGAKFSKKILALKTKVSEFKDVFVFNLLKFNFKMMLTVVIEDSFWFLVFYGRDERSYKHIHYGYQQDNKENKLGLWRAE